ncbi:unnamed protein product, partial [Closterium sp. NIES-53]
VSEFALPSTARAEALHTFTFDSGASRCFFRDNSTLTPLTAPVPVKLADPSGGPVLARSSTVLPCSAVPSGSLSGLHLPFFSTNLVSTTTLQDAMVTTTTPGGQRVSICMCTRTGRHLATFTCLPGLSLYTLSAEPPHVATSAEVSASGVVAAPCSCRLLSHHRLGHPSLPRLRGMHSRLLVSGLPRSLPPLPPSPASPCRPCVEGRQRATPHSSSFPSTIPPLQTLHVDVWGPAPVEVSDVLIPWIRAFRLQLRKRFRENIHVPVCTPTEVQNGVAECRIGLVMEVACTSMIHAAAPHFLWLFSVRALVPLSAILQRTSSPPTLFPASSLAFLLTRMAGSFTTPPCAVSSPLKTSGAARGAASVGAASGGAAPASAEPGGAEPEGAEPGGAESKGAESGGAEPGGAEPGGTEPEGAEPGVLILRVRGLGVLSLGLREWFAHRTCLWSGDAGAGGSTVGGTGAGGAEATSFGGAGVIAGAGGTGGAGASGLGGARTGGTGAAGAGGVGSAEAGDPGAEGFGAGGTGAGGARAGDPGAGAGGTGAGGARAGGARAGDPGAGGAGAGGTGAGGAGAGGTGVGDSGAGGTGAGGAVAGGARAEDPGAGAGGTGGGGAGAGGTGAGDPGAGGAGVGGAGASGPGAGGTVQRRPFFVPPSPSSLPPPDSVLRQVLNSPLPAPSPYAEQTNSLTESREPESRSASPVHAVRTGRRVPRPRPTPVPGTHVMALRSSSVPLRVPLPSPPASSLPDVS